MAMQIIVGVGFLIVAAAAFFFSLKQAWPAYRQVRHRIGGYFIARRDPEYRWMRQRLDDYIRLISSHQDKTDEFVRFLAGLSDLEIEIFSSELAVGQRQNDFKSIEKAFRDFFIVERRRAIETPGLVRGHRRRLNALFHRSKFQVI